MLWVDRIGLAILILTWGALLTKRSLLVRYVKFILPASAVAVFSTLFYYAFLQYKVWEGNDFSKFFLPPYQNLDYFTEYVGTRFFLPWILALLVAFFIPNVAKFLHRRLGERFFEAEEIPLMALGTFLVGYPGFLFYWILVLLVGVLLSTLYLLLAKGRAPLYHVWLPAAIFVIIMKSLFVPASLLNYFNF